MTGSILLSGKERGGSDGESIVTDAATPSGRQKRARRFAVGRGRRLEGVNRLGRATSPACAALLPSRLPRPIPIHLLIEFGP